MKQYPLVAQGLYRAFLGYSLMSTLGVMMAGTTVGGLFSLGGYVLCLMGLRRAGEEERGFFPAFVLEAVVVGLTLCNSLLAQTRPLVASYLTVALPLVNGVALYLLLRAAERVFTDMELTGLIRFGRVLFGIYALFTLVSVALTFVVVAVPLGEDQVFHLGNFSVLASLLSSLAYMFYLFRSSRVLERENLRRYEPVRESSGYGEEADDFYDGEYDEYDEYDEDYEDGEEAYGDGENSGEVIETTAEIEEKEEEKT